MTQTSNRIFDEMARLMNDAAGVAQGVRSEVDTLVRTQTKKKQHNHNKKTHKENKTKTPNHKRDAKHTADDTPPNKTLNVAHPDFI